ncbi:MAG: hypothetical protein ACTS7E_02460 [Arsenophonus sp. NC-CH8-MAG3]
MVLRSGLATCFLMINPMCGFDTLLIEAAMIACYPGSIYLINFRSFNVD